MAMLSFAFSVHNFISSVGADAGFAAIVGLAVLVLLYFAHARETANLREEAALLIQRLQQAEARVAQLTRLQAGGQAQAAPATAPAPKPVPGLAPFAPAGTAAPALAAATRVIPLARPAREPAPVAPPEPLEAPVPALAVAAMAAPAASALASAAAPSAPAVTAAPPAPAVPAAPSAMATPAPPPSAAQAPAEPPRAPVGDVAAMGSADVGARAEPSTASAPPPVPAAVTSEGPTAPATASSAETTAPPPATAAGGNGAGRRSGDQAPMGAAPAWSGGPAPARGPQAGRQLPPLEASRPRRRSWLGRTVAVAVVALAGVAAAVVLLTVTSVGAPKHTPSTPTTNAPSSRHSRPAPGFRPSAVTVAVLNGTSTNQLAHHVASKLVAGGYREGAVATAANQTQTTTVVGYVGGTANRADALHVASALGLRPSAVGPVDQSTLQVACPVPAACTANVVVTVGADLATL